MTNNGEIELIDKANANQIKSNLNQINQALRKKNERKETHEQRHI